MALLAAEFAALFYVDFAEVGINGVVVAVAYDDHVVVTGHFGDTYYLTIEDTFNVFAAFAGDIDTIVFDGNPFDGGWACTPKPEEMKPEDIGQGSLFYFD